MTVTTSLLPIYFSPTPTVSWERMGGTMSPKAHSSKLVEVWNWLFHQFSSTMLAHTDVKQ